MQEVLPEQVEFMQQFSEFPAAANPEVDRVISVRPLIVFIVWNAINQMVGDRNGIADGGSFRYLSMTSTPNRRSSGAARNLRS